MITAYRVKRQSKVSDTSPWIVVRCKYGEPTHSHHVEFFAGYFSHAMRINDDPRAQTVLNNIEDVFPTANDTLGQMVDEMLTISGVQ